MSLRFETRYTQTIIEITIILEGGGWCAGYDIGKRISISMHTIIIKIIG